MPELSTSLYETFKQKHEVFTVRVKSGPWVNLDLEVILVWRLAEQTWNPRCQWNEWEVQQATGTVAKGQAFSMYIITFSSLPSSAEKIMSSLKTQ